MKDLEFFKKFIESSNICNDSNSQHNYITSLEGSPEKIGGDEFMSIIKK